MSVLIVHWRQQRPPLGLQTAGRRLCIPAPRPPAWLDEPSGGAAIKRRLSAPLYLLAFVALLSSLLPPAAAAFTPAAVPVTFPARASTSPVVAVPASSHSDSPASGTATLALDAVLSAAASPAGNAGGSLLAGATSVKWEQGQDTVQGWSGRSQKPLPETAGNAAV
jgi:hypothetical protein